MLPKLVRDKIPDIIRDGGQECEIEILSDEDYIQALDAKLVEELAEYRESHSLEELADLMEVILDVTLALGHSFMELSATQLEKRRTRGAFQNRILLKSIYDKEKKDET